MLAWERTVFCLYHEISGIPIRDLSEDLVSLLLTSSQTNFLAALEHLAFGPSICCPSSRSLPSRLCSGGGSIHTLHQIAPSSSLFVSDFSS